MTRDSRIYCPQDVLRPQRNPEGPLADLTLVFKDLYHVAGECTGAGNPAWLKSHGPAPATSPVLAALLDAGIRCVGRVQTDELAYSLNGQNIHYGTPVNPAAPERLPGGSSSGSVVAVACGDADVGLGTDTGGSIRVPASYCGVYGIRPTHGRLSADNMVPLAPSLDTPGWFCRDARTLERVGTELFGEAPATPKAGRLWLANDLLALLPVDLQTALAPALARISGRFEQVEPTELATRFGLTRLCDTFRVIQGRELWQQHGEWLRAHPDALAADIQARVNWAGTLTEAQEQQACAARLAWCEPLGQLLSAPGEWLCLPTTPDLAPRLTDTAESLATYRNRLLGFTAIAGLAGLPQVHLPLIRHQGVPFGLSLVGIAGADMELLALARQLSENGGTADV